MFQVETDANNSLVCLLVFASEMDLRDVSEANYSPDICSSLPTVAKGSWVNGWPVFQLFVATGLGSL